MRFTVRWRLNDLAVELRQRWTMVHVASSRPAVWPATRSAEVTLCGLAVPEFPYDADRDAQIPDGAPRCKRCTKLEVAR